ncbi:MAG: glycosyltransferase family 4 protein [Chloroflexi bacterium]|nr:glycosyltransferase family 4 protein [Chloroflexota bacterium]
MKVLMVSKALVVGTYQRKLEEMARFPGLDLLAVVPPLWREGRQLLRLERRYVNGYRLAVEPMVWNGHFHLHWYPFLFRQFRAFRPDLVHVDEEPYNLATFHTLWLARRWGARTLFFTWQNLARRYPFPFNAIERYCYDAVDGAIAGSQEAEQVLRAKGFHKPVAVVPQFGVDPDLFSPDPEAQAVQSGYRIGYVGRLVPQKGLAVLLEACAGLGGPWRLDLAGDGPMRSALERQAYELGVAERVFFHGALPSGEMPRFLRRLHVLVLPSLTTPSWKEQFGRVLVEAMASGVPVVGSDSGEIPHLIGEAGLIVSEGDRAALRQTLLALWESPGRRAELSQMGRERVLNHYSQRRVAELTYQFYQQLRES